MVDFPVLIPLPGVPQIQAASFRTSTSASLPWTILLVSKLIFTTVLLVLPLVDVAWLTLSDEVTEILDTLQMHARVAKLYDWCNKRSQPHQNLAAAGLAEIANP